MARLTRISVFHPECPSASRHAVCDWIFPAGITRVARQRMPEISKLLFRLGRSLLPSSNSSWCICFTEPCCSRRKPRADKRTPPPGTSNCTVKLMRPPLGRDQPCSDEWSVRRGYRPQSGKITAEVRQGSMSSILGTLIVLMAWFNEVHWRFVINRESLLTAWALLSTQPSATPELSALTINHVQSGWEGRCPHRPREWSMILRARQSAAVIVT
jgi:hypothetical protein